MRKDETIRWTKQKAATEFGLDSKTLTTRLRAEGIEADKDGRFSTQQICAAVFGDMYGQRLRLTREQADKLSIENSASRRELVPAGEVLEVIERGLTALRQAILSASNLEAEDKDKLIKHLRECGEAVALCASPAGPATAADGQPVGGTVPVS